MGVIKEIILEGLNGLSFGTIKLYLFQLLLCGFLGICSGFLYKRKYKEKVVFPQVSLALSLGIVVPFIKYSTPLAILSLGVLILLSKGLKVRKSELPYLFLTFLTVLAVSAGFFVFASIGYIIGAIYLILSPAVEDSE